MGMYDHLKIFRDLFLGQNIIFLRIFKTAKHWVYIMSKKIVQNMETVEKLYQNNRVHAIHNDTYIVILQSF
jgi:hypothetical protein